MEFRDSPRNVDFVIPERESLAWREFLEGLGFPFIHGTPAFFQFQDAEEKRPRVDLMIVGESTWETLNENSVAFEVLDGVSIRLASPEHHLIAMKLRAVQSPHRRSEGPDWGDIVELSARAGLDPETDSEFADLVIR